MSDEYENVSRGKLKLKTDTGRVDKKHKKRSKKAISSSSKEEELILMNPCREKDSNTCNYQERAPKAPERQLTKAELSFKKMQAKIVSTILTFFLSLQCISFVVRRSTEDFNYRQFSINILPFYGHLFSARETDHGKSIDDTQATR